MDIRPHRSFLALDIKGFALKATASAILAINTQTALALSCPTEIYGNLPGVCDFDGSSGSSVTVENGGSVGGINMGGYPGGSYIKIDTQGSISSTGTTIAIKINNSTLVNGLSNQGTISTTSNGTTPGISISNSSITGGIFNNGLIETGGVSLQIESSTISGGILNTNTIRSNTYGTGIWITSTSTINGDITNYGTISGSNVDSGLTINGSSTVNGDIINGQGSLISAYAGNAILMSGSSAISGSIVNNGTLQNAVGGNGIELLNQSNSIVGVGGNITNNGTIMGALSGISIHNNMTVNGGIFNNNMISGGTNGVWIKSQVAINGGIFNSGMIRGGTNGILIESSQIIIGSLSNSGTIQGEVYAINVSNAPTDALEYINILGQNARFIGAVSAVNSNVNVTNGAVFTNDGSFDVSTFNVASDALFNMVNPITVESVANDAFSNSGTLSVANATQSLTGNYTQNTGGAFQIDVANATQYGQLAVSGAADFSNSGNINVQIDAHTSIVNGAVLSNVLSSGSTFTSPTHGFDVTDNSYLWTFIPALNATNNGLNLTATINPNAYLACQNAYCQGAANAIITQVAQGNTLFSPYAALPTAESFQVAASQATPELTNENTQVIQLITRAVMDIVPMWSSLRGRSSGDAMLYPPGKLWVKPYGASMNQNARNSVDGFNATAYGAVFGKDIKVSQDWLLGGAFAAGGDNMHGKSVLSGQSINSNAYQGIFYATKNLPNQIYVSGQGLFGYEINHTERAIPLYASTAKGSYNSWFTNMRAEAGWRTSPFSPNFVFTPEIDASYLFINQGSYQESGSLMDLQVASNNNNSLILGAYGNGAYHCMAINDKHDLTLTGYAGIAGDVINSQPQILSTFVASGASFSTFGVQWSGVMFRGGVGLVLTSQTKPVTVELNYDLQAGNNAYSGIGAATIKYKL